MAPINVLYLIRTWAVGGSHTILLRLLKHLPKDRYTIITVPFDTHSGGDEKFVALAQRQGIEVADDRIPWKTRMTWTLARDVVSDLVERHQIDLIHTHDPHSNVLIGLGRKRWPCACVASPYGWWDRWLPLRSHIYTWMERQLALPQFDRVITVSQNMRGKILRGPTEPNRIRVIHTGIDLAELTDGNSRDDVRRDLGIPYDAVVAGMVSRLYVEKGHVFFLQAAARLARQFPQLHLLIVGEGPLRPALEDAARKHGLQDRVTFTGFYNDLPGALRAMDAFVLPSILDEGFPTVLLEAQAMGLPVIATQVGGTHETLREHETGILVPRKNTHALAEALKELLKDPSHRKAMGKAAATWIRESFTLDTMLSKVEGTYEEALASSHFNRPGHMITTADN